MLSEPAEDTEPKPRSKTFSLMPDMIDELEAIAGNEKWPQSVIARAAFGYWLRHYRRTGQLTISPSVEEEVA